MSIPNLLRHPIHQFHSSPKKALKLNSFFESLGLVPPSSNTELMCTKEEDGDVMFIEIVLKDDDSRKE
ncbi:hypothetical protein Tco_0507217 [Tanacetum coccineum]